MNSSDQSANQPTLQPLRVAVMFANLGRGARTEALTYLILSANQFQTSFEFEVQTNFWPTAASYLQPRKTVSFEQTLSLVETIREEFIAFSADMEEGYGGTCSEPDIFILVSLSRMDNHWYGFIEPNVKCAVLALGNWSNALAPPTLAEFIYTNVLLLALDVACPALDSKCHAATRGCIGDFTPILGDAKYKVLSPIICSECREVLSGEGILEVGLDVLKALDTKNFWSKDEPHCVSAIMNKLGLDLFKTKALKPSFLEGLKVKMGEEFFKLCLTFIVGAILTAVALKLGVKPAK